MWAKRGSTASALQTIQSINQLNIFESVTLQTNSVNERGTPTLESCSMYSSAFQNMSDSTSDSHYDAKLNTSISHVSYNDIIC